ncbi:MAG: N-acetylmuramoyl-L-alanine amidase [Cyanobacteriota bacterium]
MLTLAGAQRCLQSGGIPKETFQEAHPTNYDRREKRDAEGQLVEHVPMMIVLHETVASEEDTLNFFRTPHPDESDQASYHMLIPEDGRRVRIVSDADRAFGAGNSAFSNYTIRLKPNTPGSINNVALHLSFVSPPDGRGEAPTHSGYTERQYRSAAAQVLLWQAAYAIPLDRLTTHKSVDQSQSRTDPRSFEWKIFLSAHSQLAAACGLQAYASIR